MENYEIVKIDENSWRIEDTGVRFFCLPEARELYLSTRE